MPAAVLSADPGGRATAAPLVPPLKWAGGKRWQVPILEPLWRPHAHRRLVEPFCGGLAVALGLRPERALLNDVNPHVIAFYRWLQRGLRIDLPLENDEALYYAHRVRYNALLTAGQGDSAEAAGLFYFLNRTGYNGLCRFNRKGGFNVPFGTYARIRYQRDFAAYREVLAPWTFTHGDIESIPLDDADFVYADPPYDVPFTHYARGGFSWDDQIRAATRLAVHRGPVVLVNQATPRVIELYTRLGYALQFLDAPRRISCTGDRTRAREVLASRNLHTIPG
jgi:DNA adenine methylase